MGRPNAKTRRSGLSVVTVAAGMTGLEPDFWCFRSQCAAFACVWLPLPVSPNKAQSPPKRALLNWQRGPVKARLSCDCTTTNPAMLTVAALFMRLVGITSRATTQGRMSANNPLPFNHAKAVYSAQFQNAWCRFLPLLRMLGVECNH